MQTTQEQKEFLDNLTKVLGSTSAATCATSRSAPSKASGKATVPSSWFLLLALIFACFSAASATRSLSMNQGPLDNLFWDFHLAGAWIGWSACRSEANESSKDSRVFSCCQDQISADI
ncbi:hypothetical protein PANT_20d00003 [Moesziomyces antarcticus T-34]|uniref:Uncharacterized protein n=1 Tax=Pseudozyma antarctica (strain T-34) TaxID=1151754 RepID=M9LS39_PSEA3|nr:hypothetical protein PANT_20d00003 [Moesziomyces antarcticus T-34]